MPCAGPACLSADGDGGRGAAGRAAAGRGLGVVWEKGERVWSGGGGSESVGLGEDSGTSLVVFDCLVDSSIV